MSSLLEKLKKQVYADYVGDESSQVSPASKGSNPEQPEGTKRKVRMARHYAEITQKLNDIIIEPKAYTDQLLSLNDVAHMVGTNEKYLSRYMKEVKKCNFATFINNLRILYSAELLISDKDMSVKKVAETAGFNSHSTFLHCFRDVFMQTPSVYRQTNGEGILDDDPLTHKHYIEFSNKLREIFPRLTDREIEHCHLIAKGVEASEQAKILGLTYGSLLVSRSRMRTKMNLKRSDHIDLVISHILNGTYSKEEEE